MLKVWLQTAMPTALVEGPPSSGAANPLLVPACGPGTAAIVKSHHYASSSRAASDRDRPVTPASSPGGMSGGGSGGAVDGCGGHCVAFENFCYYCIQVRTVRAEHCCCWCLSLLNDQSVFCKIFSGRQPRQGVEKTVSAREDF